MSLLGRGVERRDKVVSNLGRTGRDANAVATAALDPEIAAVRTDWFLQAEHVQHRRLAHFLKLRKTDNSSHYAARPR
jgi:hypothetical protein